MKGRGGDAQVKSAVMKEEPKKQTRSDFINKIMMAIERVGLGARHHGTRTCI